jgi:lipopolysaccharide transport system permease protein
MLLLYTTVFSVFLRVRLSADAGPTAFALQLLAGLLPWTAFSEAVSRSVTAMREHQNLIKKVIFPLEIIPLSVTGAAMINHGIALAIFLAGVLVLQGWTPTLLLLPVVVLPLILLTTGVVLVLASSAVFLRDLEQAIGLLLMVGLFLTPILYPAQNVPPRFHLVIALNPFSQIVEGYRRIILEGRPPDLPHLAVLYLVAGGTWALGHWWFGRSKAAFADVL